MQEMGIINLDLRAIINLRYCNLGEQFTESGKCELCFNSYSVKIQTSPGVCLPCPNSKAICPGGSIILPKHGFWRMSFESEDIIACENEDACLGASIN